MLEIVYLLFFFLEVNYEFTTCPTIGYFVQLDDKNNTVNNFSCSVMSKKREKHPKKKKRKKDLICKICSNFKRASNRNSQKVLRVACVISI